MEPQPKLDPLTEVALRSLKDIALPPPVSWMPQTWGWLALAVIFVAAIAVWAAWAYRRWRHNAYRREALRLLDAIAIDLRDPQTRGRGTLLLGELIKRTALAVWLRDSVASTSGPDWVKFLSIYQGSDIGAGLESYLNDFEYQNGPSLTVGAADQLVHDARHWIESHHVSA